MIDLIMKLPGTYEERWENVESGAEEVHEAFDEFATYLGDPNFGAIQMNYYGQSVIISLRCNTVVFGNLVIPGDIMEQFFKIKPRTADKSFTFLTVEITHYTKPSGSYADVELIYALDQKG